MEYLSTALTSLFHPLSLLIALIGVVFGVTVGAIPGINGSVGIALLLPLTYSLSPTNALLLLGGIYMGSTYGGSISAILLNCPGTGESACTALDGNPMALQGKAKEALYYAAISSGFGGFFGIIVMIFFTPVLADFALKFGPPEMFLVTASGLAVVGSLMGKRLSKGFFAVSVGLIISMIGVDSVSGNYRLDFGSLSLKGGIPLIPVSVGVFAVTEMVMLTMKDTGNIIDIPLSDVKFLQILKDVARNWATLFKSMVVGTVIGILPGTGGAIASFISYGEARRSAKDKDSFGQGNPIGIIAPECANNAAVGGSFVPLLALGIPGSATSAIIFGALTIHGLIPGPKLFVDHAQTTYTFMIGMLLTVLIMVLVGVYGVRFFAKVLAVKIKYIIPTVLTFAIVGAYSARNNPFDVAIMIAFGIIGVFFRRVGIPNSPILLGLILGSMTEQNLRRSILMATSKNMNIFQYIFMRPLSLIIAILFVVIIVFNFKDFFFHKKKSAQTV